MTEYVEMLNGIIKIIIRFVLHRNVLKEPLTAQIFCRTKSVQTKEKNLDENQKYNSYYAVVPFSRLFRLCCAHLDGQRRIFVDDKMWTFSKFFSSRSLFCWVHRKLCSPSTKKNKLNDRVHLSVHGTRKNHHCISQAKNKLVWLEKEKRHWHFAYVLRTLRVCAVAVGTYLLQPIRSIELEHRARFRFFGLCSALYPLVYYNTFSWATFGPPFALRHGYSRTCVVRSDVCVCRKWHMA